jgi:hypothetical protein
MDSSVDNGRQVTQAGNMMMIAGGAVVFGSGAVGNGGIPAVLNTGGIGFALIGTGLLLTGVGGIISRRGFGSDMYARANIDSSGRILLGASLASLPLTVMATQDQSVLRIAIPVECGVGAVGSVLLGSAQDLGNLFSWDKKGQV